MTLSYAAYGVVILLTVSLLTSSVNCKATELSVYDPGKKSDMNKLDEWFSVTESAKNLMKENKAAMYQLENESCPPKKNNKNSTVCKSFQNAKKNTQKNWEKICPESGLWIAECYALYMYTDKAHVELNGAAMNGDFQTHKIVNYLINCAVRKLSLNKNFQVGDNVTLYRCIKGEYTRPKADRIFWKTFTSTSLDKTEACGFGSTKLEFELKATKFGAKIMPFSMFPHQEEVLIPPFESFDVIKSEAKNPEIRFTSTNPKEQRYDLSRICRN